MKNHTLALALAASLCLGRSASAYVATTNLDPAVNVDGMAPHSGSEYTVTGGSFRTYTPTSPSDPTIQGGDLSFYRFNADTFVGTISGNTASVTGTYRIFYDQNQDGIYEAASEPTVSFGNVNLTVTLTATTPFPLGTIRGLLTQTQGPSVPNFTALPSPATVNGNFLASSASGNPSFVVELTSVPEPGTWAMLAAGMVGLASVQRLRRRTTAL